MDKEKKNDLRRKITWMFGFQMFFVRRGLYTGIVAQRARVVLLAGMPHLVLSQRVVVRRGVAALLAPERLLAGVRAHVKPQRAGHGRRVAAHHARVRSRPYVYAGDVLVQQILGGKVPGTVEARQVGPRGFLVFRVDRLEQ